MLSIINLQNRKRNLAKQQKSKEILEKRAKLDIMKRETLTLSESDETDLVHEDGGPHVKSVEESLQGANPGVSYKKIFNETFSIKKVNIAELIILLNFLNYTERNIWEEQAYVGLC